MSIPFAQKAGLRLCALIFSLLIMGGLLHKAHAFASEIPSADRIRVTVVGQGPDVLFIPGLASSAHVWDVEADALKAHFRVHLVQLAGFAGTPAGANANGPILQPTVDAIDVYIHAAGLNHPAVIGHSLGGLMGLMLARQHPEDIGRLMLVDSLPWYGMIMGPNASLAAVTPIATAMRDRFLNGSQDTYAAAEPKVMARLVKSTGPAAQAAIAAASASDHGVVARAMYEDLTTDMRSELPAINTPVTMLYPWDPGTGVPQGAFDALYQGAFAPLPHKTLIRIDGAYHFIQIDQPEAFDRAVRAFLR